MRRGPLAASYPGAVALVVLSLVPYLALSAAVLPLAPAVAAGVGLDTEAFDVTVAASTGAYTAGTVVAIQLAVHLPVRRLLVVYEALFVIASCLAAWAPSGRVFAAAFIAQGFCTSLMLIAAVPPLVTRWPAAKMPVTGAIMNVCIFGAVAVGPTVGAALADLGEWRPLFIVVAALSCLAAAFAVLTFEDQPPQEPDAPWDVVALGLAVAGCGAAFVGAGMLQATLGTGLSALLPLVLGFAALVVLVAHQYVQRDPLMPVRAAATSVPVSGILMALAASAAAFGLMELVVSDLAESTPPATVALLFLPEFGGAVALAGLFGLLFRTRFTPLLAMSGLVAVAAAAVLFAASLPSGRVGVAIACGLLGLGVGASVSPGLFMAGFSLRSALLARIFAMIELLRGVTAFLVAPVLVFVAGTVAASRESGVEVAVWICAAIAGTGLIGGAVVYFSGRRGLATPDIDSWQEEGDPAWPSPRLFDRWRTPHGEHIRGAEADPPLPHAVSAAGGRAERRT